MNFVLQYYLVCFSTPVILGSGDEVRNLLRLLGSSEVFRIPGKGLTHSLYLAPTHSYHPLQICDACVIVFFGGFFFCISSKKSLSREDIVVVNKKARKQ